ncbi:MAG: hypothetical protein AAF581_01885 [Planctomycetota bacterium]
MSRVFKPLLLVAITCLINFAVMVTFFEERGAHGTGTPLGNGDVNGDRSLNTTDAVYLLDHLFNSGPPPVAIASGGLTPEQAEILGHMTIEYLDDGQGGLSKTIRFTGVNVQVVNGLGATNGLPANPFQTLPGVVNGVGNLIVGYNDGYGDRTGSHNIVCGFSNQYASYGGIVGGSANRLESALSAVISGNNNVCSGSYSTICSGTNNSCVGAANAILGGDSNSAQGAIASICGGFDNTAVGHQSVVVGGASNAAVGQHTTVVGGALNTAGGSLSVVVGGQSNVASGPRSVVGGGSQRTAPGPNDWTAGVLFQDF